MAGGGLGRGPGRLLLASRLPPLPTRGRERGGPLRPRLLLLDLVGVVVATVLPGTMRATTEEAEPSEGMGMGMRGGLREARGLGQRP